jgi:hypothetical protein
VVRLLERRFTAAVPVEKAWAHLARVSAWPSWARHIRRIELTPPGPLTLQSQGVIRLTNGVRSTFRMTELNPGVNWRWAGPFLWLRVEYDHRFHAVDARRSEIEFVVDGTGAGVGALGRLFAAIYAMNLDRAIPRLVAELEGS